MLPSGYAFSIIDKAIWNKPFCLLSGGMACFMCFVDKKSNISMKIQVFLKDFLN